MNELVVSNGETGGEALRGEALDVAREMASAYKSMVEYYRAHWKEEDGAPITTESARAMVENHRGQVVEDIRSRIANEPKSVSWHDLETLSREDEYLPAQAWQEIKAIALEDQRRGAVMIEATKNLYGTSPYERAQMIALRQELRHGWQPQNGIEDAIIEQMALAHWQYFQWINRLTTVESTNDRHLKRDKPGEATLPRVDQAQASDTAAAMADRFNRIFLRCVRSLRDLRRYPVTVNGGQVNIAEKQVNVTTVNQIGSD
jgi:hypothetical protein